jgi:F-type H+-transporting ATPase subunit b
MCATSADFAVASEEDAAEPSLFAGDIGNAIWTLLIFALVLVVLGKFAWGPILKGLQNREKFIHDSLADAKRERVEAQRTLAEYAEKLDRAREEATAIVDEGRRDAEEVRKKILADTKVDAEAVAARAKKEIELARDDAVKQLHDQTILLATRVAGKIVHKELSPGDHQELVDQALTELGELN